MLILFALGIVLLLLGAGCSTQKKTNVSWNFSGDLGTGATTLPTTPPVPPPGRSGGASSGSYPMDTYFAFDCNGAYKETGEQGGPPWNHHTSFSMKGNVPFPVSYDPHVARIALYTAVPDMNNPLHISAERTGCWGPKDDCKPCHFLFEGDILAGGMMSYDQSAGTVPWTVIFSGLAGAGGVWQTQSIHQTVDGCPVTEDPVNFIEPAYACYEREDGAKTATPFSFSDGSPVDISPYLKPGNVEFTSFNNRVTFHIGRAPS